MFSETSVKCSLLSGCLLCLTVTCVTLELVSHLSSAQPTASIGTTNPFASGNKFEDKGRDQVSADKSFQQFISSKPSQESTIIGEIKPNASNLEKLLLRAKVADIIRGMQEMESAGKKNSSGAAESDPAECYIEVTRVSQSSRLGASLRFGPMHPAYS